MKRRFLAAIFGALLLGMGALFGLFTTILIAASCGWWSR